LSVSFVNAVQQQNQNLAQDDTLLGATIETLYTFLISMFIDPAADVIPQEQQVE